MDSINIQELQRVLTTLARQTSSLSANINSTSNAIGEITRQMDITTADYRRHITELRRNLSDENVLREQDLEQSRRVLEANRRLNDTREVELRNLRTNAANLTKERTRQLKLAAEYTRKFGRIDDATTGAYEKAAELAAEIAKYKSTIAAHDVAQKRNIYSVNQHTETLDRAARELETREFRERISRSLIKSVKDGLSKIFPIMSAAQLTQQVWGQIKTELATGFRTASTPGEYDRVGKLGLSATDLTKLAAEFRRGVMAAGGTENMFQFMEGVRDAYHNLIPLSDQARFAAQQMNILTNAGITPTADRAAMMAKDFERLQKISGMTGDQFNAVMADIVNTQEYQTQMRLAASQKERETILRGTQARVSENVAVGMMADQAIKAEKALLSLASAEPTDRYQQAAQYQALFGALGLGNGAEFGRLLKKTPGSQSAPEMDFMRQSLIKLSNEMDKQRRDGYREFTISALSKGLDPQGLLKEFSTTGKDIAAATDQNVAAMGDLTQATKDLYQAIEGLRSRWINNPYIQAAGVGVSAISGAALGAGAQSLWGHLRNRGAQAGNPPQGGNPAPSRGNQSGRARNWSRVGKGLGIAGTIGIAGAQVMEGDYAGAAGGLTGGALGTVVGTALGAALGGGVASAITAPLGAMLGGAVGTYLADKISSSEKSVVEGYKDTKSAVDKSSQTSDDYNIQSLETSNMQLERLSEHSGYLKTVANSLSRVVEIQERQLKVQLADERDKLTNVAKSQHSAQTQQLGYKLIG